MKYHNAKAISPVIKADIISSTGSCRAQLLKDYLKTPNIAPMRPPIT